MDPMRIILLGESDVGKSHYGAQLLMRLNQKRHALKMRGAAKNISAFEEVTRALNEGKSAGHTARATYLKSEWPVIDEYGQAIDLEWPDYGGEQVKQLIDQRQIPEDWRDRLIDSKGWLLMVRIQQSAVEDDSFSRPLADIRNKPAPGQKNEIRQSSQARLVELLQILLFIRGVGTSMLIDQPALMVMLSCWDELGTEGEENTPVVMLAKRLPLLASFVNSNWATERVSIVGLSALGRPLQPDSADEAYVNEGPEQFGYVVNADGTRTPDLSVPVANLAAMVGR